jgi:hypothetical protein
MSSVALKIVRKIRTIDVKGTIRSRPFTIYWSMCLVLVSWANYAQYHRLSPMYPNFENYRKNEGGRMVDAKRQELADVMRYNNMVNSMRSELNKR